MQSKEGILVNGQVVCYASGDVASVLTLRFTQSGTLGSELPHDWLRMITSDYFSGARTITQSSRDTG